MSSNIKDGCIIDALFHDKVDAIGHVCNNKGVMGSGVALSIKQRLPAAFTAYRRHEELNSGIELGTISMSRVLGEKAVFNLHAQDGYGESSLHLSYDAFFESLRKMRRECDRPPSYRRIGFPYMIGSSWSVGGDWGIVQSMISCVFEGYDVTYFKI